jgi:hypothetical protein
LSTWARHQVWLENRAAMLAYGPHPKHVELMELQKSKLTVAGDDAWLGGKLVPFLLPRRKLLSCSCSPSRAPPA